MLGELLGAGASILGGIMGNKANAKAAEQQYQHQKEFAQSGIQWKVKDAEAAGIHPLYALGANTVSYSPQSVGGPDFSFLGQTGQNLGRAIDATRSMPAKLEALSLTTAHLQNEGLAIDNETKKLRLASAARLANQTQLTPGVPSPFDRVAPNGIAGQGNSPHLPPEHAIRDPQFTKNLRFGGRDIAPDPSQSDAQTFEDRYGETVSDWIVGPYNAYRDFQYNTRSRSPDDFEKVRRGMSHKTPARRY